MNQEKFDVQAYNNCVQQNNRDRVLNPWICKKVQADSTVVEMSSAVSENGKSYIVIITPPPPALIKKVKEYYDDGTIKLEYETYVGVLDEMTADDASAYGVEKLYDQKGNVVKTVDHDQYYKKYKIDLDGLFEILKNENVLDSLTLAERQLIQQTWFPDKSENQITVQDFSKAIRTNGGTIHSGISKILDPWDDKDRKSLHIGFENGKWNISKDLYPNGIIQVVVNARTGKVEKKEYRKETRP